MDGLDNIKRSDFYFDLADEKIAKFPLEKRDESKLLVYRGGVISDAIFGQLADHLEEGDHLIFNNAKVIPARLYFRRETGAIIEVLLLEPFEPANYEQVFNETKQVSWNSIIGNLKKWKDGECIYIETGALKLEARLLDRGERIVQLNWNSGEKFTDVLHEVGKLPIPPYLNRDTQESDYETYQTVFAKNDGSVAAPTAGLHFTEEVLDSLKKKQIRQSQLTLHVGAGTFLPVKEDEVIKHPMHREHFEVRLDELESIRNAKRRVAVGTTSLRVLESLYYCGLQLIQEGELRVVGKLDPYHANENISYEEALDRLIEHLKVKGQTNLLGATEIMILPQYKPKSIKALMTNFHLPESTLLMLISSIVGSEWTKIYDHALAENYRFLSYGDSSLLFME